MIANTNAPSVAAPSSVPAVSTRAAVGLELSGRMMAATIRAASPKARLNQKMPRQFQTPTRMPPTTGPMASAKPDVPAQTPIARLLALASGYSWRSIDSVPGSLAAAPTPITARPAMSTSTFGASAPSAEHRGPGQHDLLPAELVPDHPAGQHQAREGQRVGADDPLQLGRARTQVGIHLPQRDADHRVVEEGQEQQRAQRGQRQRRAAAGDDPLAAPASGDRLDRPGHLPGPTSAG